MRESCSSALRISTALLIVGIALAWAPPAAAEDAASAMQHHLDAARKARAASDWDTANTQFELALRQAELLDAGDSRVVRALEEAARAFQHQKDGGRAIELQERAVDLQRAASPSPGNALAETLYRLARLYVDFDAREKAEAAFREALEIRERLEPRTARVSMMRRDLSKTILALRPDDAEAEELLQRDLELADTTSRREHMGRYYAQTKRHESAIAHFEEAVAIARDLPVPSARRLVNLLTSLATEYKKAGRFDDAEAAFLEAIELREDDMGAEHPYLAFTLRKLAGLYMEQERWLDAETALLEARDLNASAWGEKHHECSCTTSDMLTQVRIALGKIDAPADPSHKTPQTEPARSASGIVELDFLAQANAPVQNANGVKEVNDAGTEEVAEADRLIRSHDDNARRLRKSGDIEAAKDAARRALTLREETYGADSLEAASGLERLGRLWKDQRRADEAIDLFERRLTILETQLDPDDPKIAATLVTLGQLERQRKRWAEAEHYFLADVNFREAIGQRIEAARTLESIGNLNLTRNLPERAAANFARAIELWEDIAGDRAPEIVRNRVRVASAYLRLERLDEAEAILVELVELEEGKRFPDTGLMIQILQPLKTVLERTDRQDEAQVIEARLQELRTLRQAALNAPRRSGNTEPFSAAKTIERAAK